MLAVTMPTTVAEVIVTDYVVMPTVATVTAAESNITVAIIAVNYCENWRE